MRNPEFSLCENKGADQLRSICEPDQRLRFRHSDNTISLLPKSEISSFLSFSETEQTSLCRTWLETPKTGFLASRLNFNSVHSPFVGNIYPQMKYNKMILFDCTKYVTNLLMVYRKVESLRLFRVMSSSHIRFKNVFEQMESLF